MARESRSMYCHAEDKRGINVTMDHRQTKRKPIDEEHIRLECQLLLEQMTLEEKVSLLSGKNMWQTVPIQRLGISSLVMTDGPHGVRAPADEGRTTGPATSFPTGASMAATWNPKLITRVGRALGEEARAMGCDILLAPCINIVRHPLAGRNFECFSEDPYLAGKIGVAYVQGVQSQGVGTSIKHFACNNQEIERFRGSSELDERAFREIYLSAFERVIKEAKPWTVMCSYNRINGVYASEHHRLLTEILRDEWGFEGAVISDWGANHSTVESIRGGLDLEMPGPAKYYGNLLVEAVRNWQVDEEIIDDAARRILRLLVLAGKINSPSVFSEGTVNTSEHQVLARAVAEESITLLKNEETVLPIDREKIKSIAVIGPNAAEPAISGGGSAHLEPPYKISPLSALHDLIGSKAQISYEKGCHNIDRPVTLKPEYFFLNEAEQGLKAEFYNNTEFAGEPALIRKDIKVDEWGFNFSREEGVDPGEFSARWDGFLKLPDTGLYNLYLNNTGDAKLYLDGALVLDNQHGKLTETESTMIHTTIKLTGGRFYRLKIEYRKTNSAQRGVLQLKYDCSQDNGEERMKTAVELARRSDLAIVFVGMPEAFETEGTDRPHMDLMGLENELITAVAEANSKTVVVLNTGSPVTMPWIEQVPGIIQGFYYGQEGGRAVAEVLLGEVNPSGKLSVTYPRRLEDTPAYTNYPGTREVRYGEGIFVGYRWYDKREIKPLFPFGHGLSYTTFEYGKPRLSAEKINCGEQVRVVMKIKNTGKLPGQEVVQLYIRDLESSVARPVKELKGDRKSVV